MKTIILDTNTLMAVGQFKIDIFSEIDKLVDFKHEIKVLDKTVDELNKIIKEQKGKQKGAAKLGLEIIRRKGVRMIKASEDNVDDVLVDLAEKGAIIVTQDKELKERIKGIKGKILTIRQKKKIVYA